MKEQQNATVSWFLTTPAGDRVREMEPIGAGHCTDSGLPTIEIDRTIRFQRIVGFGGTFNESGWYLLSLLSEVDRQSVLRSFFDPVRGAGYSVCASPIGHNDYSLAYYSYDETTGDEGLRDFSIERDREYLIPYIRGAKAYGRFLLASRPDYPPKWMLTQDRSINPRWYRAFARYLSRFVTEYHRAGIDVTHISLANEPRVYLQMDGNALNVLLRDHVGPVMRADHPDVKLFLCDSYNRDQVEIDWTPALRDPVTRAFVDGLAYHSYHAESTSLAGIKRVAAQFPEIPLWQTEVMNLYTLPFYEYTDGERWGTIIMDDLSAGASSWIFWNLLVDENGGPWNTDPFNTGYPQDGVAVIDQRTRTVTYTAKYYYFQHFSQFVRPGSVRVAHRVSKEDHPFPENALYWVRVFPFITDDGGSGLVCMNTNEHQTSALVRDGAFAFSIDLPGHSIATFLWH